MYKVTRHDQSENTMLLAMLTGFIVLAASPAFAELEWRPSAIAQWEREVFKGTTSYSLVAVGERDALHARRKLGYFVEPFDPGLFGHFLA
jgi:hypothetical protein